MARLTTAQRDALPASDFAGPNRTFPVEDANHAHAALSMQNNASPAVRSKIRSKVARKYPGINVSGARSAALARLANRKG